ncbi:MAG: response regulator transcription factor [Bacteroidales bacterium]|nr:response regulator transcription factor [Bacteroidales bacterium]
MMIKIALAEDNDFLAYSIQEKISFFDDLKFKFRGKNGSDLVEKLTADHNVDVVLMDIQMPEMDGITATALVKQKFPQIRIIMLTVFDDEENIFKSIQAGADGYLLKDENAGNLHRGILEIMEGGAPMTPSIARKALKLLRNPDETVSRDNAPDYDLTKREIEVLEHLSKGLNYSEIADNLFISQGTVRKHIENIYRKLQVRNKLEAVNLAKKERII